MSDAAATPRRRLPAAADVRGAAQLAVDATAGLVDLVEAVHAGIARAPGLPAPADGRTRGITGLVYRTVRGVTRLAGGGVDALLGLLATDLAPGDGVRALDASSPSPAREALVAALNGVLGDHLEASGNPLAIALQLRFDGQPLVLQAEALRLFLPQSGPAVAVLVHGLCMNDLSWARGASPGPNSDGGAEAASGGLTAKLAAAGYTTLALHYNSGRSIARNGADFAQQLEALVAAWPVPLRRLVLVGHSMGGLVARSAQHQAQQQGQRWPSLLSDLACVGTPHQGAPLEQLGHAVTAVLGATPYAKPFARLARLRSAGITDLRHGRLLDDRSAQAPLPAGVRCLAVAGTLGEDDGAMRQRVLGDGLVPLPSALGQHADPARALHFEPGHTWVGAGIGHLALITHPAVHAQLLAWLAAPTPD
jgi:PGAP1-like protein